MPSNAKLFEIEMRGINAMSRRELLDAIFDRADDLPADLQIRGEDESIDRLRLILCAARLIHLLRHMPRQRRLETLPDV
jgi:hypothetical protein